MRGSWRWVLGGLVMGVGCAEVNSYRPAQSILPANIQRVHVAPFVNRTPFPLEEKLRLRVEQEFLQDGRLATANSAAEADGVVTGEIASYVKSVLTYDANNIAQRMKLWVVLNLRFVDQKENKVLWDEPNLDHDLIYDVETYPGGLTEEQAREALWDLFARDAVRRTLEGFGSVSGSSSRKVPTSRPLFPGPDASLEAAPKEPKPAPSPY